MESILLSVYTKLIIMMLYTYLPYPYPLTDRPTFAPHLPTNLPTYLPTYLPTKQPTNPPTNQATNLPTHHISTRSGYSTLPSRSSCPPPTRPGTSFRYPDADKYRAGRGLCRSSNCRHKYLRSERDIVRSHASSPCAMPLRTARPTYVHTYHAYHA